MARPKNGTDEIITEKALTLFYKNGYEQTPVSMITAEIGITSQAFYKHFANKEAIMLKVLDVYEKALMNVAESFELPCDKPAYIRYYYLWGIHYVFMDKYKKFSEMFCEFRDCNNLLFTETVTDYAQKALQSLRLKIYDMDETDLLFCRTTLTDVSINLQRLLADDKITPKKALVNQVKLLAALAVVDCDPNYAEEFYDTYCDLLKNDVETKMLSMMNGIKLL